MTQDARDQEHENTQPSDTSASGESPQQTSGSDDAVGNEDLATAFLRETEVVEEAVEDGKKIRRKGIYLLPNLFTTSALFSGFFAVVAGINGEFTSAAVAIFIAMVLDGLDGRVARMTNTQSEFGAEYDSLADMISFGMAPALVAFTWILQDIGKTGWVVAFLYVACAALRLARFNVQIGSVDKSGLSVCPARLQRRWLLPAYGRSIVLMPMHLASKLLMLVVVGAAGILMVSNIRYYSFKDLDFKKPVPFVVLLAVVLGFVMISVEPSVMLLLLFAAYVCSGPVLAVMRKAKPKR
ncbi:phosphatidylserine synthase [Vreelandella aquamarina]|nr:phosphatidylserine synthase [Halomonas axialensis]